MLKQLTILFWCAIYGEVFGYIISALNGAPFNVFGYIISALNGDPFNFVTSGLIPMIAGWILINFVSMFLKAPNAKEEDKK